MRTTLKQQSGFTLIELVMVIVILGILAATALPKFVDLRSDASLSVANGYGGALSAAGNINFSGCAAKNFVVTASACVKVAKCSDELALLTVAPTLVLAAPPVGPALTAAKTIYIAADTAVASAGATVQCAAVYGDGGVGGQAFTFTATGT